VIESKPPSLATPHWHMLQPEPCLAFIKKETFFKEPHMLQVKLKPRNDEKISQIFPKPLTDLVRTCEENSSYFHCCCC